MMRGVTIRMQSDAPLMIRDSSSKKCAIYVGHLEINMILSHVHYVLKVSILSVSNYHQMKFRICISQIGNVLTVNLVKSVERQLMKIC